MKKKNSCDQTNDGYQHIDMKHSNNFVFVWVVFQQLILHFDDNFHLKICI